MIFKKRKTLKPCTKCGERTTTVSGGKGRVYCDCGVDLEIDCDKDASIGKKFKKLEKKWSLVAPSINLNKAIDMCRKREKPRIERSKIMGEALRQQYNKRESLGNLLDTLDDDIEEISNSIVFIKHPLNELREELEIDD